MIHVLHVIPDLGRGGAERVTASLIAATDRTRFRHSLCYLRGRDDLAEEIRASGCAVICLNAQGRLPWLSSVSPLRRELRRLRPDVIHSAIFEAHIAARIARLGLGIPHLNWLVSMDYDAASVRAAGWSVRNNRFRLVVDAVTAHLSRSKFIACSNAVARSFVSRLGIPSSRMEVIYNPVAPTDWSADAEDVEEVRSALKIRPGDFVWLSVGRQDRPKGHRLLIEAFSTIARECERHHLILIGQGPASAELVAQAEGLELVDRIHFLPSVPKVGPYLRLANAFVFPSLIEGLPVALLEAMCAGLPCIASDIPAHTEIITHGHNGLIVPPGSADSLTKAMLLVAKDGELRRLLSSRSETESQKRFGTGTIIPEWEGAYEKVALETARYSDQIA